MSIATGLILRSVLPVNRYTKDEQRKVVSLRELAVLDGTRRATGHEASGITGALKVCGVFLIISHPASGF